MVGVSFVLINHLSVYLWLAVTNLILLFQLRSYVVKFRQIHGIGTRAYRLRSALTCLGSVVTIFVLLNQLGASA